ncbi:MAG: ribonuclease III [Bacilli bacterium]|nr:ribonuclease III [Bacilli bacterium]
MINVDELKQVLNIDINDASYYELALTHPSCNGDAKTKHKDYERLEFIGDAVLGFVCGDLVYKNHPDMDEGLLSKLRSYLVRKESLSNYARKMHLENFIRVGHSISKSSIVSSNKILEDVFEALVGAIYLDKGFERVYKYVSNILIYDILHTDTDVLTDHKSKLQELMQSEQRDAVTYVTIDEKGPAHDKTFVVNVLYNGIVLGTGSGKSKKEAEEKAAKSALEKGII